MSIRKATTNIFIYITIKKYGFMEGSIVADVRPVNSFSLLSTGYAQYESFGDVPF